MILINNIKVSLDTDFNLLSQIAAKQLKIDIKDIKSVNLYRKSVDARRKDNVHFCISLCVETSNDKKYVKNNKNAQLFFKKHYEWPKADFDCYKRPVVVGFGPAGMFAALALARAGLKPLVIERGCDVETRTKQVEEFLEGGKLNTESNVQFGEGGAGTFSDGKLNTGIKDYRCQAILEAFVLNGANQSILTDAKPHIGTDVLRDVVKNIREEILSLGGEVRFSSRLDNINVVGGKLKSIVVNGKEIECEHLVLAIGHSARDTFKMLYDNLLSMERKPFSVGVRIEHLQSEINKSLWGEFTKHPALNAADYKMAVHLGNGRGVYTFCMCPGGYVINASSEENKTVVNGMSYNSRSGLNANSALLVEVKPQDISGDDVLGGCEFQRRIEQKAYEIGQGKVPITTVGEFVFGEKAVLGSVSPTVKPNSVFADITEILPEFVCSSLKRGILEFDKKINGFAQRDAIITAPETRSSSPIRILRGEDGQSLNTKGIYPCGEGAGYAGGIMSAATDGLKTAEKIIGLYQKEKF